MNSAGSATERLLIAVEGYAYAEPAQAFCGRYIFSGETVQGGQGVVAFARDSRAGMQQFAIKYVPCAVCDVQLTPYSRYAFHNCKCIQHRPCDRDHRIQCEGRQVEL